MTTVDTLRQALADIARADKIGALRIASELREWSRREPLSARQHAEIRQALEAAGVGRFQDWMPKPLEVGETYLLTAGTEGGAVGRLRVLRDATGFDAGLCSPSRAAVRSAWDGLHANLLDRGCGPPEPFGLGHRVFVTGEISSRDEIEGESLGLSIAVATLSLWLGRAPAHTFAGTARVLPDGTLERVARLDQKLQALRSAWPDVTDIVISRLQDLPSDFESRYPTLRFVRASNVVEAAEYFGLPANPEVLPICSLLHARERLDRFRVDNEKSHQAQEWLALSQQASYVATLLGAANTRSAEALAWAILFALHAGELDAVERYVDRIDETELSGLPNSVQALWNLHVASARIDRDAQSALTAARAAVALANACDSAAREELIGRAHGTLGRALMHAGHAEQALSELSAAVECHRATHPEQVPRSLCYLATAHRLAGRAGDALEIVKTAAEILALPLIAKGPNVPATRRYLALECARCELALDSLGVARDAFLTVMDNDEDASHPRIAAIRGLAQVYRRLGQRSESDALLRRCLLVADRTTDPLRRIAAAAAGEALLDLRAGHPTTISERELLQYWAFVSASAEDIASALNRVVY